MKPPARITPANKDTSDIKGNKKSNLPFDHFMEIGKNSAQVAKAYTDLLREKEITQRAIIEGQKEIFLGEQKLTEAELKHDERMTELGNEDRNSERQHEVAMRTLSGEEEKENTYKNLQDRVLKQLEAKEISAADATELLRQGRQR